MSQSRNVTFSIADPDHVRALSVVEITSTRLSKPKSKLPDNNGVLSLLMGSLDRRLRCTTCENDTLSCPGHFGHIEFAAPIYHFGFVKRIAKTLRKICYWCAHPFASSALSDDTARLQRTESCKDTPGLIEKRPGQPNRRREMSRDSSSTNDTVSRSCSETRIRCAFCTGYIARYTAEGHRIRVVWPEALHKKSRFLPASKALSIFDRALLLPGTDSIFPDSEPQLKKLKNAILTVLIVPPPCIRPSVIQEKSSKVRGQDDLTRLLVNIVTVNNKLRASMTPSDDNPSGKPNPQILAELQWTVSSYMHNDVRGERKATNRTGGTTRDLRTRLVGKSGRVRNTLMGKRVNFSARDVITPSVAIDVDQVGVPLIIAETLLKPVLVTSLNHSLMTKYLASGIIKYVHVVEEWGKVRRVFVNEESLVTIPELKVGWKVERRMLDEDYVCMNRHPSLHRVSMMGHRAKILPKGNLTLQMNPAICPPYNCDFDGDEMNLHLATTVEADAELQELLSVNKNVISPQNSRLCIGAVQDCALGIYMLSDENIVLAREDVFQLMYSGGTEDFRIDVPHTGRGVISSFLPESFFYKVSNGSGLRFEGGVLVSGRMNRAAIHATLVTIALDYNPETASRLLGHWQRVACYYVTMRGFSISMDDCLIDEDSREAVKSYLDVSIARIEESSADDAAKNAALGSLLGNLGSLAARHTTETNAIVAMSASGAKGNSINLTQIRCAVGQQNVNGTRTLGCLPGFKKSDQSCERFGFVRSCYSTGLSPTEFFHHAMSGREGIVDTAVKTAETGYLGRRLAKGFESVRTLVDRSVRNAFNEIIQFEYGNDGYDPSWLEIVSFQGFYDTKPLRLSLLFAQYYVLVVNYFVLRAPCPKTVYLPCDPTRVLQQALHRFPNSTENYEINADVKKLLQELGGPSNFSTVMLQAAIVFSVCCFSADLGAAAVRWAFTEIRRRHNRAFVSSGEMVGIVAAQSIAQPATQLTLNTFHYAGVVAFNVTLGLPRLKELTDATTESLSPSMVVPLLANADETQALRSIQYLLLGKFIILLEFLKNKPFAKNLLIDYLELDMELCIANGISPRFVLDRVQERLQTGPGVGGCSLPSHDTWYVWLPSSPEKPRSQSTFNRIRLTGTSALGKISASRFYPTNELSRCTPYPLDSTLTPRTLLTTGSSFEAFFGNAPEFFDVYGAYTNNLHEVYAYLGVEAASAMLFFELRQVLSFEGTFVHDRHFRLIVDVMTHSGAIVPLSRHGLNKNMNTGILARASFEATVDQLLDGALRGEVDHLRGVSENIFLGLFPPMGTGTFDVISEVRRPKGAIVSLIPKIWPSGTHVFKRASPLCEIDRIFDLANILVPYSPPGFSLGNHSKVAHEQDSVPDATTCPQICSQMNEFVAARNTSYRPSTPITFQQTESFDSFAFPTIDVLALCAELEAAAPKPAIDIMGLYSDIYGPIDVMSLYADICQNSSGLQN
jgi:DNA-directed RNA polymerase beta' subunit